MSDKSSAGVFGGNSTSESPSAGISTVKVGAGQKIKSAYPQDNQSGYPLPNTKGGAMGGGDTYLGHSLKGSSAVQEPNKGNRSGI